MVKKSLFLCKKIHIEIQKAIFNHIAHEIEVIAKYAGIRLTNRTYAEYNVIEAMKETNINLNNHKSKNNRKSHFKANKIHYNKINCKIYHITNLFNIIKKYFFNYNLLNHLKSNFKDF
ncbi:MAG: hypothetical protein FWH29_09445 [Methanobrevibacter sp.]|nr:hypothetical protein [Methanobrevibacter sp.]